MIAVTYGQMTLGKPRKGQLFVAGLTAGGKQQDTFVTNRKFRVNN